MAAGQVMVQIKHQALDNELGSGELHAHQIIPVFPSPNEAMLMTMDQHLRGPGPGIVVATHGKAVRTGTHNGQQLSCLRTNGAVLGDEVAAFADRPNHIHDLPGCRILAEWQNIVPGPIKSWAQQIIHGGIHHTKLLAAIILEVFHPSQQNPCIPHQGPAQLYRPFDGQALQGLVENLRIIRRTGRVLIVITNTHPPPRDPDAPG